MGANWKVNMEDGIVQTTLSPNVELEREAPPDISRANTATLSPVRWYFLYAAILFIKQASAAKPRLTKDEREALKMAKEKERQEKQRMKLEAKEAEKQAKIEERKRKEDERRLAKEKEEREKQERKERKEVERKKKQESTQYV